MNSRYWLLAKIGSCSFKQPFCSFLLFCGACFRLAVRSIMKKLKEKWMGLFSSRGCFGCCIEAPVSVTIDDPSKRPRTSQGKDNSSTSGHFWSSGTNEMDSGAASSQSNGEGCEISRLESAKHGLLLWNQIRKEWLKTTVPRRETLIREPKISWNATYESLLDTDKPFRQPIPLKEMVDFLVDVWEQEGLYD